MGNGDMEHLLREWPPEQRTNAESGNEERYREDSNYVRQIEFIFQRSDNANGGRARKCSEREVRVVLAEWNVNGVRTHALRIRIEDIIVMYHLLSLDQF